MYADAVTPGLITISVLIPALTWSAADLAGIK